MGRIIVDTRMATSVPGIWAAGDIVNFPLTTYGHKRVCITNWNIAMYLGKVAALNIMGQPYETRTMPFYWTDHFGNSIWIAGHIDGFDDIVMTHQKEERKICIFYCLEEVVLAVVTVNRDTVAASFATLRRLNKQLRKTDALAWAEELK